MDRKHAVVVLRNTLVHYHILEKGEEELAVILGMDGFLLDVIKESYAFTRGGILGDDGKEIVVLGDPRNGMQDACIALTKDYVELVRAILQRAGRKDAVAYCFHAGLLNFMEERSLHAKGLSH